LIWVTHLVGRAGDSHQFCQIASDQDKRPAGFVPGNSAACTVPGTARLSARLLTRSEESEGRVETSRMSAGEAAACKSG
jgi:hypothetical protein